MEKRLKKEQKADTAKRRQKRAEKNKRQSQQKRKIGKLLMRNKTTLMRVTLRGPFNVPNKNMKN